MAEHDQVVREELKALVRGGNAHMSFDDAIAQFPLEYANTRPPHVPYTPWHLLEHLRIAQWDILEFIRNPQHVSPPWPDGYWPARAAQADQVAWNKTVEGFRADLQALIELTSDQTLDLYTPLPHGDGQTIVRELQLVADHNAYHIGEFAILRQIMGTWRNHENS
ncbi:DinB family protein [Dictyobacter arantiisoli]|uniref:DinB-like domain-containing protein n=1 Tax=Dictyobacter arantiisoli TaxID=2014874 RepID=A0A5A5TAA5_9CHLR|nr:DinB family protein [Dictyobacter arantiisoli]GCF08421.1 hypothetical protein KDI_19850 [Dictyobacter arantiisoli]